VLKKFIAPILAGGVLLGAVAATGTAYAAAPTASAAAPAHAGKSAVRTWLRAHRREIRRDGVAISAKTIGVTPTTLVSELRSGKSIADVAGEHGVSAASVVGALTSAADARINKLVASKKLTSAEATKIEAALPSYLTKAVNHTF
jgi:short-subunit dehydrogenase